MPKHVDVKVPNLLLDPANPRLPEGERTQPETIHAMLRAEGPKTLALAKSISEEGLSPMDRLLVIAVPGDSSRTLVLEGNRRVTALKILGEPALADGAGLTPAQLKNLRKWSAAYRARGEIAEVPCVLFDSRPEADVWIIRRHRGDQRGVGVVQWGATESARFDARRSGKRSPELQVLDFVSERGRLDAETREKLHEVSITNLKRLMSDRAVRDALGIALGSDGTLSKRFPDAELLKGLVRVVRDLAHEKIKVRDIYTAENRKNYLAGFKPAERPSPAKALGAEEPLMGGAGSDGARGGKGGGGRGGGGLRARPTLIPGSCACDVKGAKLRNIYGELRRLRLESFPNAISVLLRVFLEFSVDDVIEKSKLMDEKQASESRLRHKLTKVADHLASNKSLTEKQAKAAKKTATDQHLLQGNVTTFHEYVHNKELAASPTDLRTTWDNLQPLFEAIWPAKKA